MNGKQNLSEMRKILEARPDDPNINQLLADMDSAAYAFRLNRFNELSQQVDKLRNAVYQVEMKQSDKFYQEFMKDSYNRATFDLQQHTGLAYHFNALPEAEIKRLSRLKWSGDNYSGRIWDNTGELARQLKNELLVSWMTGRSNRDVVNSIAERFDVGRNNARRLVRTEAAFFHNEMEALSYKDADIEYYRFIAVLDKRTSAICREHDNKVYKVSERKTGVNYPPLHPWCRSTTVAHFDDVDLSNLERRARDPETGKTMLVPADMSYDDWHEKYVAKGHQKLYNNIDLNEQFYESTVGKTLLTPTKIYVKEVLKVLEEVKVAGIAHITGGGFHENLPRALKDGLGMKINKSSYEVPEIFKYLQEKGKIDGEEMYHIFNMGVGMALIVNKEDVDKTLSLIDNAFVLGEVTEESGIEIV